jgi:pilus assembly protein FimV
MSDPSLEEESLISQDDIDKLLDSSSIGEAEETLEKGNDNSPDPDMGELSQDDIDTLLTGSSLDDSQEETREDSAGDELGELSQEDIDGLLDGNDAGAEADELGELSQEDIDNLMGGNDAGAEADEMGELSQEDIDGLMGGNDAGAEADEMGELSQEDIDGLMGGNDAGAEADELGELSQEDIDGLMGGNDLAAGGDDGDDVDMELISQNDIDQLMTPSDEEPDPSEISGTEISETQTNEAETVSDDFVIDEADGLDVSACLITQETLDELIRNASDEDVPDPVVLDEDIESPPVSLEDQSEDDLEFGASDELEGLLNTDINDTGINLGIPDGDDVSQDDIDALLQASDEDEDFMADEEDILISQDDIDTLLMAADQEDEDLLGDLMGDDLGDGMDDGDDNFDDEDILDGDDEGDAGPGGDQVVLAGGEDDFPDEDGTGKPGRNWVKSRLVIAAAFAILVLGISVPVVYFLFFSQAPVQVPEKMSVPMVMEAPGRDIEVASVDIVTAAMDLKKSGNIILSDFVVLASDLSKDMAYVTADISIDYFDQRAYHEINDNLSFYRDLIYESIQKNLLGEKGNEVTEEDLIWGIETSLKKVFPSDYIEKVSFKSFKAS